MTTTKTGDTIYKFTTNGNAMRFTYHAIKIWMIVLGDDEMFWAVTPAHATRLLRQGYELADF